MENSAGSGFRHRFWPALVRAWLALTGRKVRVLHAVDTMAEGAALYAVSHAAGFLQALVLAVAMERPVHCLLPENCARGPLARFLARQLDIILCEGELADSEATLREAVDVLAGGGALNVFADQNSTAPTEPGASGALAALLVERAEAQHVGRRIAIHPVHLFLPGKNAPSREILIYIDSAMARPEMHPGTLAEAEMPRIATALESRFQENAFQLRPADVEYFLTDLEEVLRTGLQEDWASRPDWKQDTDGFVLSRLVADWVRQTNYLHPARLVALRSSLDDYRHLQRQCALRQLEVEGAESPLGSGWRKLVLWLETLLGLPIALYGLVNHLAIGLVLLVTGSFRHNSSRSRTVEWIIRGVVTLAFYTLQIYLVAHHWGRAAAGYYAPTLLISGGYLLLRYVGLVQAQARLLFISLTIPGLRNKISRLRRTLLEDLDQTLNAYEERAGVLR